MAYTYSYRAGDARPNPKETEMNTEKVTVAGKIFTMPLPFDEGHVLTAGEAGQLNQVYHENLRNNIAKKVKDAVDKNEFDQDAFQAQIDKMASEYEFGKRRTGGPRAPADPVLKEALHLATEAISTKLKAAGKKPSEFSNLKEIAQKLVDTNPAFKEKAAQIVADRQAVASATLDDVMGELTVKAETAPEAPAQAA